MRIDGDARIPARTHLKSNITANGRKNTKKVNFSGGKN